MAGSKKWEEFWSSSGLRIEDTPRDESVPLTEQRVADRLTRYYLAALTVVAILSLAGLWLINNAIRYHESDSRVLNISGRQRMLSQKLTKLALIRVSGHGHFDKAAYFHALNTWQDNHKQLETGILRAGENYRVQKSKAIDEKFAEIKPVFLSLSRDFAAFGGDEVSLEEQRLLLAQILSLEPSFLQQMDEIVSLFDNESLKRVGDLRRIEYIMVVIVLVTLLLEALLIFRPIVRYTKEIIRELSESRIALSLSNEKLKEANDSLYNSQQEVLRLQEARHLQILMEDQIRAASLMEGQEEERKRLARELHDGVGQMLTGLKLLVGRLKKTPSGDPSYRSRFEEVSGAIQEIIIATRQISHNVMPDTLVDYGLGAALEALTDQVQKTAESKIRFKQLGVAKRLSPNEEIGLYRIAQESLVNALKHANAGVINILLNFEKDQVVLDINDNGGGFDTGKTLDWRNAGLENMQTRARLIRADFSLSSKPETGTRVLVTLSLI